MPECSGKSLADILGLTERRIQQLAADGAIKRLGRGKYDLIPSIRGYIEFLKELAKADERKLTKENVKIKEMKREEMQGVLVNAEELDFLLEDLFVNIKTRIREATTNGAQEITGKLGGDRKMQATVEKILKEEHDGGVLTELSQWKPTKS